MTSLADRQAAFLRAILDDGAPLPDGWSNRQTAGMAIYRGNYRSALMGALAETYERTARYVGEGPFTQARMHHAIGHPPSGWTIDEAGAGFDATCAQLFAKNPEVAELAWLEWSMLELATAPNSEAVTPEAFGEIAAGFGDEDWGNLRLTMQPRAVSRIVDHNLTALWQSLAEDGLARPDPKLPAPQTCLAWREGERPTFVLVEADHHSAFTAMQSGATYGELIAVLLGEGAEPTPEAIQNAAMRAGAMLGKWLQEGLIVGVNP
ncbi:HvfC/BufC family peptide modification chaperone [Sulfitobacter sp.]|uniref:HvfC/BufC family peptide modification chaperone n=1 Tax=Sulfitobacter sp. TaxID=1903071 RepID=UPI003EF99A6A